MRFFRKQPDSPPEDAPEVEGESTQARPGAAGAGDPPISAPGDPRGTADEARPVTGATPVVVAPPLEERVDGLRAWLAHLDRKLGIRTYALGAAVVLALAAGIVGVVLAVSAKDESATKAELRSLRDEVQGVGEEAAAAAEDDVASLSSRIDELETRVTTLASQGRTTEGELSVVQDDIDDLRGQISDLEAAPPAADPPSANANAPDAP